MQAVGRILLWSLLPCVGMTGVSLHGQPAPGTLTPDSLSHYCATQPTLGKASCNIALDGQYTLQLQGDWQVPRSLQLHFAPGSVLHIAGGVLDFAGGSVEAAANDFLFPDGDRVRGLTGARPEWFGPSSPGPFPAAGLAAAYRATVPWGTLYLQSRRYISPFDRCPAVAARLPYDSPRTFVGSGRPMPDSPTNPARLLGGTVLLGGIMGTAPLRVTHLGFDAGPVTAQIPEHPCGGGPGVFIEQPSSRQFVAGDRLEDVSVLTMGAFNMHSVMIAGHQNAEVRDLWLWTLGGTHGLVMKSSHSVVDGLHCWGALADCLIVKSDYATDLLGRAVHDRVTHVEIHPLQPGGNVGGIFVDSAWDTVHSLDMRDITETGTRYGMVIYGSRFYRPRNISIENWSTDAVTGTCLFARGADALHVSAMRCGLRPSADAGVVLLGDRDTRLERVSMICEGDATACAAAHTDGVRDDAAGTVFRQIQGQGLGGYLLRSAHAPASPGEFHALAMDGRLFEDVDKTTMRMHITELAAEVKPDLRILYTALSSQMILHPNFFRALIVLAAMLAAASSLVHRHRQGAGT